MRASLRLDGDLDDVELIQDIERSFGIRLPDDEVSRCYTVGDIFDLVAVRLPEPSGTQDRCATAMTFYRVRPAVEALSPGTDFQPPSSIGVLRGIPVRSLYKELKSAQGLRPPNPYLSIWGALSLTAAVGAPVGLRFYGASWWIAGAALMIAIAAYRVSPVRFPPKVRTIRDFVRLVAARNVGLLCGWGARLRRREAWDALQTLCDEHSGGGDAEIGRDTLVHPHSSSARKRIVA